MAEIKSKKEQIVTDTFEKLVNGGRSMGGVPMLPEIPPLEYDKKEIVPKKAEPVMFPEFNEEESYKAFLKEKQELRKRYEKFLKNHATPPVSVREEMEIFEFDYRKETKEDAEDFSRVLNGEGEWKRVKIPYYEGPVGEWKAYYRTTFTLDKKDKDKTYHLDFSNVDYKCAVYLNGRTVVCHEGFFAPFSALVTSALKEGENVLIVVIKNEVTCSGHANVEGIAQYGNRIHGASHLGYDEPNVGWHHNPEGAGIIGKIKLITANKQRITDIWCRPNIDKGTVAINTTLTNYFYGKPIDLKVYYTLEGRNFKETIFAEKEGKISQVFINENFLSEEFEIPNFRLWTQDEPYLYQATVTFKDQDGNVVDSNTVHFGMRKFHQDENSEPKGKFYLNNQRIMLRGANEMGHLPRCVMEGNYEQLIDDILIAKISGMTFWRLTQRPVFSEIYDYMDMLGMMIQTDFPMFGSTRYNLLPEVLKQTCEMEKLTRSHPSVVIESFCNETLDTHCWHTEQYWVDRYDLEELFEAMRKICKIYNPDRVVKYCDGDYAVLEKSWGLTEFHTYNLWYVCHGIEYGKFNRGWLPGIRTDWMAGCGEYGTDALDSYEIMHKYYPKDWLPKSDDELWSPAFIKMGQCYSSHANFFPEQDYIRDWIKESREWQRKAVKMYVHTLRRRADRIQSCAIHLLIDAWPAGWTKTLVDVDRIPKPGYYAFKEANIKTRISLRRDQYVVYEGDTVKTEFFALNDKPNEEDYEITATAYLNGNVSNTYNFSGKCAPAIQTYLGEINLKAQEQGEIKVVAKMVSGGVETFDEVVFMVKPKIAKARKTPVILDNKMECLKQICDGPVDENIIFVSTDYYEENKEELEKRAYEGAKVYLNLQRPIKVLDKQLAFRIHILPDEVSANNLVWNSNESKYTKEFGQMDFQNFYDKKNDYQTLTNWFKFDYEGSEEMLYTLTRVADPKYQLHKKHKMVATSVKYGKGEIILSTITALEGCIGNNPVLDKFFVNIIEL